MRSRGFCIHSSHRFSLEPVLEVAVELASSVVAVLTKVETAPKGPVSNSQILVYITYQYIDLVFYHPGGPTVKVIPGAKAN